LSRKKQIDFYARKSYIQKVQIEGDELKRKLEEQFQQSREITQQEKKLEAAKEFHAITASLHHLLSTAGRPGIFRSPYGESYSAKAFDIPVEDHIRDAFKVIIARSIKRGLMCKKASFRKSKTGKILQKKMKN
jgi:hypothetical protein